MLIPVPGHPPKFLEPTQNRSQNHPQARSTMESTPNQLQNRPQNRSLHVRQRLQALALVEKGIAIKVVQAITEVSVRSISDLKKKARSRGYDPQISRVLKLEYVEDVPRFD